MTAPAALWKSLETDAQSAQRCSIYSRFQEDKHRTDIFSKTFQDIIFADFSKQNISQASFETLLELCTALELSNRAQDMVQGRTVNKTEQRPALHMHMRGPEMQAQSSFKNFEKLAESVTSNPKIKHIINIGIGGSSLGPELVTRALRPFWRTGVSIDFVSNIDAAALVDVLHGKHPENTLLIVASKSFKTQETLQNMHSALRWMQQPAFDHMQQVIAVTANEAEAQTHGISTENILCFPNGVGGRWSVWSAIGLPIALMVGMDRFKDFLSGAHAMDQHFLTADFSDNLPVWLGVLAVWNHTLLGCHSHVVCPYNHRLARFPAYLQQLEMESLGKSVNQDGQPITQKVAPVVWGEPGTDAQHSFFQHLHQGQECVSIDFIISMTEEAGKYDHHEALMANCFAQSAALMYGRDALHTQEVVGEELTPWCTFPGGRPSTTLLCRQIDPYVIGALLALYEHKVFVQSVLWNINPFDQFGVEYGKTMAQDVLAAFHARPVSQALDPSTQNLIRQKEAWS